MPSTENITVAIWGGTPTNLRPITNHIGDLSPNYRPRMYKLVKEPKMWLIAHTKDLTLYSMVSSESLSGGSGEVLRVDIMVPANRRIAGGKSPLDLLNKLMECAEKNAIQGGVLTTQTLDNLPFLYHLKEFHLEERPSALPVMLGSNAGSICVESTRQLDALMRFSKYPILASVSQLEMGFKCPTTIKLDTKGGAHPTTTPTNTGAGAAAGVKTPHTQTNDVPPKSNPTQKPTTPQLKPTPKKKGKGGLVAAVIAGVLVLGIGLIALLGGKGDKPYEYAYIDTGYAEPAPEPIPATDETAKPASPGSERASDSPAANRQPSPGATSQPKQPSEPAKQKKQQASDGSATTQPRQVQNQQTPPENATTPSPSQPQPKRPTRPTTQPSPSSNPAPSTPSVDNSWKAGVQTLKNKCPYIVRNTSGTTEVTDILISDTRVTISVKFYDITMYDLPQSTKTIIQNNRIPAVRADFSNLPSHVKVNIVYYDKAGRQFSL